MIQSEIFQFEQGIIWQDVGNGCKRQVFGFDDQLMMIKAKFETGGIGLLHSHPHSQVTHVDSGIFEMTIGSETRTIRKGDGYYVPPQVLHGVTCIEAGMLIHAFSPHRKDFL